MQKGNCAPYVTAGLRAGPHMPIGVRNTVHLPDSEAGRIYESDRKPFYAGKVPPAPRESVTVPLRGALICLCVMFCVFGGLIVSKAAQRSELNKSFATIREDIAKQKQKNVELAARVDMARDRDRICDMACQRLKMIAPTHAATEYVTAPDTRPFENKTAVQAAASPNAALEGMITGSR
ncbi:MAG: septum formation initiator family protein [Clostridia bacterium]|nr:septum formation initiator family protein [Clostridia bacterium]